jgi:hypothetical protein
LVGWKNVQLGWRRGHEVLLNLNGMMNNMREEKNVVNGGRRLRGCGDDVWEWQGRGVEMILKEWLLIWGGKWECEEWEEVRMG